MPRLPCSAACPYRAGWKQHLHQDKNMSNILAQHIAHKRKSQEGYTLTHFIDCFMLSGCLLAHPLSTVWIIRVHSLGVRYPVACFPTGLFGVVGQVQELPTFDTNMRVHRQHTTLHSVFVQNLPEQLRIFEALDKGPDTLGKPFTEGPLLPAPRAALAGVFIPYCSALSCCPLHGGLLGVSSAWSPSSPAVSSSIM